ncbi:MAG: HNH endonuclease domain-containing protein [Cytophagales bacterium]|nr:HNH endonuclease domain-containing protein [Cytophagales bacterium]
MTLKKIPYRLGIDIGTGSVAWAAMALTETGAIDASRGLIASGTTIFGEPVLPKEMKLKNEVRRTQRLMRRQTERKRERLQKIMHITTALGIKPEDLANALRRYKNTQELWHLRVRALDQKIELAELMLIVLRMSKNRGYNGDAPSPNKKGDYGKAGQALQHTESLKIEYPKARTIAEVLWLDQVKKEPRMNQRRFRGNINAGIYVLRTDIRHEFDLIFSEQTKHHSVLSQPLAAIYGERLSQKLLSDHAKPIHHGVDANWNQGTKYFWGHSPNSVTEAIQIALFYQHPLQGFKDKIGKCSMDKTSLRVIAAHPAHQTFRIEKLLADLRWGGNKAGERLSLAQKDFIREKLNAQKEIGFGALYKALDKAGLMHEDGLTLNFHTPRRDKLTGNKTRHFLIKFDLLDLFESLTPEEQNHVFLAWADDIPAPESWGHDAARANVATLYGEAVAKFIDTLKTALDGLDRPSAVDLDSKRTAYGAPALARLANYIREHANDTLPADEYAAIQALYPNHDTRASTLSTLPSVESLDLRSPVVSHALEYTRREIQGAIKRLGVPYAMVIELAKEVKSTLEERSKTTTRQNKEEKENGKARAAILEANCRISNTSILRYKLWVQQGKRCPYSGDSIFSIEDAVSGSKYDIEHIIPKRKQGVGNRFSDVVLASKQFNNLKGGDETPYHAAERLRKAGNTAWNWDKTEQAVKLIARENKDFKSKAELILDKTEFKDMSLDDEGFVDRQLQETQWIGRVVQSWCQSICDDVTVIRGSLTAAQRRAWGLHTILEEVRIAEGRHNSDKAAQLFYKPNRLGEMVFDKRSDHRHHLIDACVIALSTRSNYMALVRAQQQRATLGHSNYKPPLCPVPSLREHLLKMLNGYTVWHVPDHLVAGEMYDQPFGIGEDGKTLYKKGKKAKLGRGYASFHPETDALLQHTDRKGGVHKKTLVKSESACIRITESDFQQVPLAEFRQRYIKHGKLTLPEDERFLFKNDLICFPDDHVVYRVAQLQEGGVACINANETTAYGNTLSGSDLQCVKSKLTDIKKAKILRHPIELALHSKVIKSKAR